MKFDPKLLFWIQFAAWIGSGVTGGTVHLTGMVPDDWLPKVTGWVAFITFCEMGFLTLATGAVGVGSGPLARSPTIPEAQQVLAQARDHATGRDLTGGSG